MKLGRAIQVSKGSSWVLDQYYDYLEHRNLEAERQALFQIMDRPERIRTQTFSASSAGGCGRARQFTYLGFARKAISEKARNIFTNGDYVHLRHQAIGFAAGYLREAEVPVRVDSLNLTGTMDGIFSNGEIAEYKSINSHGYSGVLTFGPKPDHVLQVHAYMLASGINRARIIYENKDTNELAEKVVDQDPLLIEQIAAELNELNEATAEKRLLPVLSECRQEKGKFIWCPYSNLCLDAKWPRGV